MACPSNERLEALISGSPSRPADAKHLERCGRCRERVERLREHAALADELREAVLRRAELAVPQDAPPAIEGYEIGRELHRGGQGVVYEAFQRSTRRNVAVKVLLPAALKSPRRRRRFEREVELAASLDHPNIVTVHDSGSTADGRRFFAMHLVEGEPVNRGPRRSLDETLQLFATICRAVSHAHQRGVLHRDLKPGNILVDARGVPFLLDFGMAVTADELEEQEPLTRTGEFLGTLVYASPEHVSGRPSAIDVRSDVYSLGVVLYELLTGRFPYPVEGGLLEVARAIRESTPAPVGAGRDLETVVAHALAKEPERRYQSAGELAEDLERLRTGLPIHARRDSTWYVLTKAIARNRARAVLVAAVFLIAVVAAITSTALWRRAEAARARAESQGARAADIGAFLADAFGAVDPDRAQGRAVTLREVLDEASTRLAGEEGRDPAAELELRRTIGRAYVGLEMYGQAVPHLERAVELARGDAGADALELASLLASLSYALRGVAPTAEAEALLVEADELLARAAEQGLDVAADRALVALNRATLAKQLGRLAEAEERFEAARALVAGTYGDPSEELAAALASFGTLRLQRGEPREAVELLDEALSRLDALGAGETTRGSTLLGQRGQALEAGGRVAEARESHRSARDLAARLLGAQHAATLLAEVHLLRVSAALEGQPATRAEYEALLAQRAALSGAGDQYSAETLNDLGNEALARGDLALAEELQRESLRLYQELLAHDSYEVAVARGNLARTLSHRGEREEAGVLLRDSRERLRELLGPRTASDANALARLAWIRVQAGEWEAALEAAREALAIRRERFGDDHPAVAASLADLGWFLYVRGELDEAEAVLLDALSWHRERSAPLDAEAARCLHTLGFVRLEQWRPAEAEPLLREALELRRSQLSEEHPDLAESMNALGMALFFQGRLDEVESLWRGALAILRRQGEDYPRTAWVLGNLGGWCAAQGDLDAAEAYYEECVALARRTAAPNNPLLAVNLAGRAVLHRARGEPDEARALLVESFDVLRAERGLESPQTRQVLEALIATCDELGFEAEAEEYRALLGG